MKKLVEKEEIKLSSIKTIDDLVEIVHPLLIQYLIVNKLLDTFVSHIQEYPFKQKRNQSYSLDTYVADQFTYFFDWKNTPEGYAFWHKHREEHRYFLRAGGIATYERNAHTI